MVRELGDRWTDRASELIAAVLEGGDLNAALVDEVAGEMQRMVEAVIADLPSTQQRKLRRRLGLHLYCSLLVLSVQALEPLAEADQRIAEEIAGPARPSHLGLTEKISNRLLQGLIAKFIEAAGHTALAKAKVAVKLLRICAIANCPDPDHHAEVGVHCIAPLAGEAAHTATVTYLDQFQVSG